MQVNSRAAWSSQLGAVYGFPPPVPPGPFPQAIKLPPGSTNPLPQRTISLRSRPANKPMVIQKGVIGSEITGSSNGTTPLSVVAAGTGDWHHTIITSSVPRASA